MVRKSKFRRSEDPDKQCSGHADRPENWPNRSSRGKNQLAYSLSNASVRLGSVRLMLPPSNFVSRRQCTASLGCAYLAYEPLSPIQHLAAQQFYYSLVHARSLFAVHATEAGYSNLDLDARFSTLISASAAIRLLPRPVYCADDFCVAHFEVAAAVGGRLGRHLAMYAPQFVPATTVDA